MNQKQVKSEPVEFLDDYRAAVQRVRVALTELLLSAGADPAKSRGVAKRFKLSKNLTWMVSKIVNSTDVYSVAQHIPGSARVESLLSAMRKGGATPESVDSLRSAIEDFERMVDTHTGDRATLELMVSEMSSEEAQSEQLIHCRKQAYRGNSGMLGVQAKVHMACSIVSPNGEDASLADLVQLGGLFGFRRLRSSARWLLFRRARWEDDGTPSPEEPDDALSADGDRIPLIKEFCSDPVPELEVLQEGGEILYELPPGPVGNTAALTCVYGSVLWRTGSLYRDEHNRLMELGCNVVTPAENLVCDLLVHESMTWALRPDVGVYSRGFTIPDQASPARERNRLVVTEAVADLGRGVAAMITPLMPQHVDLMRMVFERLGWNPDDFHALRFMMQYPPIPSTILLSSELPEEPGESHLL
jgi:hypothetical protein